MKNDPHPASVGQGLPDSKGKLFPFVLTLAIGLAFWPASAHAQLPPVTSGVLFVHLAADTNVATTGNDVTSWTDQSANGMAFPTDIGNGLTNRWYPKLITNGLGHPLIRFATNSILGSTALTSFELFPTGNSGLTIFTVFSATNTTVAGYLIDHAVNPAFTTVSSFNLELGVNPGARGVGTFGLNRGGNGDGNATFAPTNTIVTNVLAVMSVVIQSNGFAPANVEIYKNGVAQNLAATHVAGIPQYPGWLKGGEYVPGFNTSGLNQGLLIGGRILPSSKLASGFFRGDLGEIIIFQGELSTEDRALVEAYLGSKYTVSVSPPVALRITAQPKPLAITNGEPATFVVSAQSTNGQAIAYQWRKDGGNITDATNSTHAIGAVGAGDIGSYSCVVSVPSISITSAPVQLRLYTDAPLPAVGSGTLLVHLRADAGVVTAGSDLANWLDQASGLSFDAITDPFSWIFAPTPTTGLTGNKVIHFEGAHQLVSQSTVQLFTETNSPLTILGAFSVQDNSIQRYILNSKYGPRTGREFRELALGTSAGNQNRPGSFGIHRAGGLATVTASNVVNNDQFNVMSTVLKSVGTVPNNTEIYQNGAFLPVFSRGANNPADIPLHPGWLSAGEYPTGDYPLYVGVGVDSGSTAFSPYASLVGDIGELIIYQGQLSTADRQLVENHLGQKYGLNVTPPNTITIVAQPQTVGITNGSGQSATLTVVAINGGGGTNGLVYQWQKNGVNLPNATNANLTLSPVSLSDVGTYRCVVSLFGTGVAVTSTAVAIRLLPDVSLPAVTTGDLLVHLRADAGVNTSDGTSVTNWVDQSTNAFQFDAIVNESPVNLPPILANGLSGNRTIRFEGAYNNVLCRTVPFQLFAETNSPVTMFTAFSTLDNAIQRYLVNLRVPRIHQSYYSNYPGWTSSLTAWFNEMSLGVDAGNRADGNYGIHRAAGDSTFAPANTISNNQFYTMSVVVKSVGNAPTNLAIFQNGVALPVTGFLEGGTRGPRDNGWLSAGHYPFGSSNEGGPYELRIGATRDSPLTTGANAVGNVWFGDIGEVIIYTGELSDSDRAAVEEYLAQKYGLGKPRLNIAATGTDVLISYPISAGTVLAGTYMLEKTTNLNSPATWTPVAPAPAISGTQYSITDAVAGQAYYRLRLVP